MSLTLQPLPALTMTAHNNHISLCDAGTFKHHISICRHHTDTCAPYWIANERRTDQSGRDWETQNIYCVPDDFGNLQEVRR